MNKLGAKLGSFGGTGMEFEQGDQSAMAMEWDRLVDVRLKQGGKSAMSIEWDNVFDIQESEGRSLTEYVLILTLAVIAIVGMLFQLDHLMLKFFAL